MKYAGIDSNFKGDWEKVRTMSSGESREMLGNGRKFRPFNNLKPNNFRNKRSSNRTNLGNFSISIIFDPHGKTPTTGLNC